MRNSFQAVGLFVVCALAFASPQQVQDLTITPSWAGTILVWSPVNLDVQGQPIIGVSYDVHRHSGPYFLPNANTHLGNTPNTFFQDVEAASEAFYRVVVRGYPIPQPDLVTVPAGSYLQGEDQMAMPVHVTLLTNAFALGRREVTNGEYLLAAQWALDQGRATLVDGDLMSNGKALLMTSDPACEITHGEDGLAFRSSTLATQAYPNGYDPTHHPVKMVTWRGTASYCDWLSLMSGLDPYYQDDFDTLPDGRDPYAATGYRLPTEAEWEYAGQHDNDRIYPWGNQNPNCTRTIYSSCLTWTMPVGSKPTGVSALGLLDMAGNVYEWCNDWSGDYAEETVTNPVGALSGVQRIVRGGGWTSLSNQLRLSQRYHNEPLNYYHGLGFRVCRTLP
ncbi:MAG: SUMF1/EgtB/PvdO family nonheme iron enzyme [bacterium]|nr:SUMF1/EgtB/PvdO family nonheme iron enzyme [bacterium]